MGCATPAALRAAPWQAFLLAVSQLAQWCCQVTVDYCLLLVVLHQCTDRRA